MQKKVEANKYFEEANYEQAIKLYTEILETDPNNPNILCNRSAAYIKLGNYNLAVIDAVKTTGLKPDWGKAWGRLGGALYGQERFDEALVAYNKANELEPLPIYVQMINQINQQLNIDDNISVPPKISYLMDLFNDSFNDSSNNSVKSFMSNPKLIEKINDSKFLNKLLSFQLSMLSFNNNPTDAMKMCEILNDKKFIEICVDVIKSVNN